MPTTTEPPARFSLRRGDVWRRVTAPTLLVRGENGTVDEHELRRMLDLRPGTGQAVIAGAGHDAHLDQPAAWQAIAWQAILCDFLTRPV